MRRWRGGLTAIACTAALASCASLSGLDDLGDCVACDGVDAPDAPSSDETSPVDGPTIDSEVPDVLPAPLDGAVCPSVSAGVQKASAYPSKKTKKLDGDLSDWECATPLSLDVANAESKNVPASFPNSVKLLIEWDSAALYVAAVVADPLVRGAATTQIFRNDAVEIFLSGATPRTGDYGPLDHQYLIDHAGRTVDSGPQPPLANPPGLTVATKLVNGGFVVEARIAASDVGKTFAAGTVLGFDLQLDDGDGVTTPQNRIDWAFAPYSSCSCSACCCNGANEQPSCNTLRFGTLTLQ